MKAIITLGILSILTTLSGQQTAMNLVIEKWDLPNWTYQHFKDNNVTHVSAFKFEVNRKGKIAKDSVLLFESIWDKERNSIHGLDFNKFMNTATGMYLSWNKFETYYNSNGLITKHIEKPAKREERDEFGQTKYEIKTSETIYEYNDSNEIVKKIHLGISDNYSIRNGTYDTVYYRSIHPQIDEYEYNELGQQVRWFHTDDSTQYIPSTFHGSKYCNYCNPRYLNVEWKYSSNGLLDEWLSYTRNGEKHTKRNYYYDDLNRLIKQIDSSGWYFTTIPPFWESTYIHQYSDSEHTITTINNTESKFASSTPKSVNVMDKNGRLLRSCSYEKGDSSCLVMKYDMVGNKVVHSSMLSPYSNVETYCVFNGDLLFEIRTIKSGELIEVIRYYYE